MTKQHKLIEQIIDCVIDVESLLIEIFEHDLLRIEQQEKQLTLIMDKIENISMQQWADKLFGK